MLQGVAAPPLPTMETGTGNWHPARRTEDSWGQERGAHSSSPRELGFSLSISQYAFWRSLG